MMRLVVVFAFALGACSDSPGAAGLQGSDGTAGTNGADGERGPTGATGPTGASGLKGDTGAPGAPGSDGSSDGTRIKAKRLTTADGYSQAWGLRDTMRGEDCGWMYAADEKLRCMPTGRATVVTNVFSNAGCTTTAAMAPTCSGGTLEYAVKGEPATACEVGYRYRVHQLGAKLATVYAGTPGSCNPTSLAGYEFYAVGAEVPAASFAEATITTP